MVVRRSGAETFFLVLIYIVMGVFALLCLYPFWYMFIYAISDPARTSEGIFLWPKGFSTYNIMQVLRLDGIGQATFISVMRTLVGTIFTVACNSFLGYLFSKQEMPYRTLLYRTIIVTMFVGGGLIPTYLIMRIYGLLDTFWIYVLPGMISAYNIILIKTYIEQLPASLEEAAMIDGANYFTIFAKVIFPLCTPIVATIAIFTAVGQWNSWFDNSIYIQNENLNCLQYLLYNFLNESQTLAEKLQKGELNVANQDITKMLTPKAVRITTTLIVCVPIFLFYPFMQRFFIKGIMIGAVKG